MEKEQLIQKLIYCEMDGYILGLKRDGECNNPEKEYVSHIYKGSFEYVEKPMCNKAPNSIWRNNIGKGICKICLKNTLKEVNKN